jgi:zinc D-Ala-D-Ala dipeptidase
MMKPEFRSMIPRFSQVVFTLICFTVLCSCGGDTKNEKGITDSLKNDVMVQEPVVSVLEKKLDSLGLVDLHELDTMILVDMKYSTEDNFMGYDMYGDFDKAYLQDEAAKKVVLAQKKLTELKPGYRLIIYDAARPHSIQQMMWDSLKMPIWEKVKFLADPVSGSVHNYGCAVDLSIVDEKGKALDMGTPYDFSGDLSMPSKENILLSEGKITSKQVENRQLLRTMMSYAGLLGITTEWWHFEAFRLNMAKEKYKRIE